VFAETTHVVAALHGFAHVVITSDIAIHFPSFIEIRSVVLEPHGVEFGHSDYFGIGFHKP